MCAQNTTSKMDHDDTSGIREDVQSAMRRNHGLELFTASNVGRGDEIEELWFWPWLCLTYTCTGRLLFVRVISFR